MNSPRARLLKDGPQKDGPVVYWMSRDQRAEDNWALVYAQGLARGARQPLVCLFCLAPRFLGAPLRQYGFMLRALEETARDLAGKNIPFFLLEGEPIHAVPEFLRKIKAGTLITDFDPLRIKQKWHADVATRIPIPFYEVDAHNIVPCWLASPKLEFGAYTIRPKIHKLLLNFLTEIPDLKPHPISDLKVSKRFSAEKILQKMSIGHSVPEVDWLTPGPSAARKVLRDFIRNKLSDYPDRRNDPARAGVSNLSPYLHFGQISAQRVALMVSRADAPESAKEAFLEELIVRCELSDNFCFYNPHYDSFEGFPAWAKNTLNLHRHDRREYLYSQKQFEQAQTHDDLWNAAQIEMMRRGKMHGYLRMYWAKKILEWTASPEEAFSIAIYLNDKYELDGRDPNGYAGIAWSLGGVHDRAWGERPVFGKIRFMSYNGCKNKFDVARYQSTNAS